MGARASTMLPRNGTLRLHAGNALRRRSIAIAAGLAVVVDAVVIATGGVVRWPDGFSALVAAQVVGFTGAAIFWRTHRPGSRLWLLLLAMAAVTAGQGLQAAAIPFVHSAAVLFDYPGVLLVWILLLAYPDGALDRLGRLSVATMAASIGFAFLPLFAVSPRVEGGTPLAACAGTCPDNPFFVGGAGADGVLRAIGSAGRAAATLLLLAALATAYLRATPPRRRTLAPVAIAAAAWAVLFATYGIVVGTAGVDPGSAVGLVFALSVARIALPLAFVLGPLQQRAFAGDALERMIVQLRAEPGGAARERVIASTLGDPTLRMAYWLPRSERWVDTNGRPLERELGPQMWTVVRRGGEPAAALVHDPTLADDPDLLAAAGRAVLLVLDNTRLEGELEQSLATLRDSRRRLVEATTAERREIERDLHAHAQQQLTALRLNLELALEQLDRGSAAAQRLMALGAAFDEALGDVRRLAFSIYSPLLEQAGLGAALRAASASMDAAVTLDAAEVGRLDPDVETTVYFVVVEAIRHALQQHDAGVTVRLAADGAALRFSVATPGRAFAPREVAHGSALGAAADRVAAVGGSVHLSAPDGAGSRLAGEVPIRPREAA